MHNLPAQIAAALDRLDDTVDFTAAIAALMFSTHSLHEVDRLHIAQLLRTISSSLAALDQLDRPDDIDPAREREDLLMCLDGVALLMNGTDPLDVAGRDTAFILLAKVGEWQRAALTAYTEAVRLSAMPAAAAAAPIATAPRRKRKSARAA